MQVISESTAATVRLALELTFAEAEVLANLLNYRPNSDYARDNGLFVSDIRAELYRHHITDGSVNQLHNYVVQHSVLMRSQIHERIQLPSV